MHTAVGVLVQAGRISSLLVVCKQVYIWNRVCIVKTAKNSFSPTLFLGQYGFTDNGSVSSTSAVYFSSFCEVGKTCKARERYVIVIDCHQKYII